MTKSYTELLNESQKFIEFLHQEGLDSFRMDNSFRDYNVKINVSDETLILYHKPSKGTFSIGTQEICDANRVEYFKSLWHKYQFPDEQKVLGLCAYVDGSFLNNKIGWGVVFVRDNLVIDQKNGRAPLSPEEGSHQIAGEVYAVLAALDFAQELNEKSITIYYDYKGLKMWATKEWKANSPIAQFYTAKIMQSTIKINWQKIAAHTGHVFNEKADKLAKDATI